MNTQNPNAQRIVRIVALSDRVFANHEKSLKWLHKPLGILNGKTPFDMLDSEEGTRLVEEILGRLDEGYLA